ncbi:MAG: hypothetical protein AB4426_00780 [Xenococcaceae cyanobacterium]
MKVTVWDINVLRNIKPQNVEIYLQANGWHQRNLVRDVSIWTRDTFFEDRLKIQLLLDPEYDDFPLRMHEVLDTLEIAENRSQLAILRDISTSWADVIRLRVNHPGVVDSSIPIEDGIHLLQCVRDMFLWAACSTINPQPYFYRKAPEAIDYIRQLCLGQTEQDSAYIFSVISPLVSVQNAAENRESLITSPEPFERQVIKRLVRGLETLRIAAEKVASTGNLEPFLGKEQQEVSANLCEAIVGINDSSGNSGIEIHISWSPLLSTPVDWPRKILLPPDAIPLIKEVKDSLSYSTAKS